MARRRNTPENINPNWEVHYEYQHGKDILVPGTKIKIKKEQGEFTFQRVVFHKEKNVMWIDCYSKNGYRAFYVDRLKCVIKPKRKYTRRDNGTRTS